MGKPLNLNGGWEEMRDLLRSWREDNARKSEEVVEIWENVLEKNQNKLSQEKWTVLEQVMIAALDCGKSTVADSCLSALRREFPGSLRVKKLKAMWFEASERYEEALCSYEHLIKEDPTNGVYKKRKIAVLKAMGNGSDCIKELCEYVEKFMSDTEAWCELCDLYIAEQDYSKAAFCMEELILNNPHHHLYHLRYAEIKYTQGGHDNMEIAKTYYAQALKLNPNNIRALYGVFLTAGFLANSPKSTSTKRDECSKLIAWATKQLSNKYEEAESDMKTLNTMINSMTIQVKS